MKKQSVVSSLCIIAGAALGGMIVNEAAEKRLQDVQTYNDKHLELFLMMNQWVKVKQEGKCLATFFEKNGYKRIAVYGMSYAGETLVDELEGSDIKIIYAIDKRANAIYSNIEVVALKDELEDVDAVVVTAVTSFDEIAEELRNRLNCPILSLEDILYEM